MQSGNEKIESRSMRKGFLYFLLAGALLVLLFFVTYKLSHQVYRQNKVNEEVDALQAEIDQLDQENQDLNELISYLQTDDFKEKEAKDKLNLIKEGEKLILVKEHELQTETSRENIKKETEIIVHHANYYWWWHYFFSIK